MRSSDPKSFGLSSLLTGISNRLRFDLLQKFSRHNELAQDIAVKNSQFEAFRGQYLIE